MLIYCLYSIAEVLFALLLYKMIFHIKLTKKVSRYVLLFLSVIALSVVFSFIPGFPLYSAPAYIGIFGIAVVYEGKSLVRIISYALLIIFAIGILSFSFIDFISYTLQLINVTYFDTITSNLELDLVLILILGSAYFLKHRKKRSQQEEILLSAGQYFLLLFGEFVSLFLCAFMQYVAINGANNKAIAFLPMVSSMFAFLSILFIFTCLSQQIAIQRALKLKQEKAEFSLFVSLQTEHYTELIKKTEELRRFKHDYNYHLQALNAYILENKNAEALDYLDKISESLKASKTQVYTGLLSLDSIICEFEKMASENDITWQYIGRLPKLPISDCFALCTVFSNLLKNAVEASQKVSSDRFIDTMVIKTGNCISVVIKNSCLPDSSLGKTSKPSSEEHGWGLKNVRRTIENNNGSFQISIKDSVCTAEVLYQLQT